MLRPLWIKMKYISLFFTICLCLMVLGGCVSSGKETSYSLAVRNVGTSEIVLKKLAINGKDYLNQQTTLTALIEKASGSEYWAVLTAGNTVNVVIVIEDKAVGQEFSFKHKFIDNTGEGYVISADYTGNGKIAFSTSIVGRLSVWGN